MKDDYPELEKSIERRQFLRMAGAGTVITALGGAAYVLTREDDPRAKEKRSDGRSRLPPGQRLIDALRPMGGDPGDPDPGHFRLHVHGQVDNPFDLDFAGLLKLPPTEQICDVHCVTAWSLFDSRWTGVRIDEIAKIAGVRPSVRHVIFEAANGYTANVPIAEALAPNALLAYQHEGKPLGRPHGPPVRSLVPDLYFWKSAKWLTGIHFSDHDHPGFWETRGYHNHAGPWREERYG